MDPYWPGKIISSKDASVLAMWAAAGNSVDRLSSFCSVVLQLKMPHCYRRMVMVIEYRGKNYRKGFIRYHYMSDSLADKLTKTKEKTNWMGFAHNVWAATSPDTYQRVN